MKDRTVEAEPLGHVDEWDAFVKERYGVEAGKGESSVSRGKPEETFRDYRAEARPSVKEFYRLNHRHQTREFGQAKRRQYLSFEMRRMGIWEAMEFLNTLVDDSDPDTDLSQLEHLLQTAEAIRAAGHPRWFILTGLIHDLGKILCLNGEPQWAVVGDTFPVGCAFSERIIFSEFFAENPDCQVAEYQTLCGVYEPGCGLSNVQLSWGHDEYLYQVVREYLPEEALAMIRYHSFYPWHREEAYGQFMDDQDRRLLPWVRAFNPFDLYSKADERPNVAALRPYYEELISEYFPATLRW